MKLGRTVALVLAVIPAVVSACGTTIVVQLVDGSGGGAATVGVGGAGGGAGGAPPSVTSSDVVASTGTMNVTISTVGPTGPAFEGCTTACATLASCGLLKSQETCVSECEGVVPACLGAHQAWLQCLAANGDFSVPGCPSSPACSQALMNYVLCKGGCFGGACGGLPGGGTCNCVSDCSSSKYETNCFPDGTGNLACECKENGIVLGKCFGPGEAKFCDAMHSCCSDLFFIDG